MNALVKLPLAAVQSIIDQRNIYTDHSAYAQLKRVTRD